MDINKLEEKGHLPLTFKLNYAISITGNATESIWYYGSPNVWVNAGVLSHLDYSIEAPVNTEPHKCKCDIFELMNYGCSCGGV